MPLVRVACMHTYIHTYIHTYRQTDRQTDRHTYIETYIHTYMINTHQSNISNRYIYIYTYKLQPPEQDSASKLQLPSTQLPVHLLLGCSVKFSNECLFLFFFQILGWNEVHLRMEKLLINLLAPRLQPWILS